MGRLVPSSSRIVDDGFVRSSAVGRARKEFVAASAATFVGGGGGGGGIEG